MSETIPLITLLKRLEIDPKTAVLLWGDVLQEGEALAPNRDAELLTQATFTAAHWLGKYAGLALHEQVLPLLRRMLPLLQANFSGEQHDPDRRFSIWVYDYTYVYWTHSETAFDLRTLTWVKTWDPDEHATVLELRLPILLKLVTSQGAKDGTPQGSAQPPQASAGG